LTRTAPLAAASAGSRRTPPPANRVRRHGRRASGRIPRPRTPWRAENPFAAPPLTNPVANPLPSPAKRGARFRQFGTVSQPRLFACPVARSPRRRRVTRRGATGLPCSAGPRRATVVVAQLNFLVSQRDSGPRRAMAILRGLAPRFFAGLGQPLADPRPEGQLEVQP